MQNRLSLRGRPLRALLAALLSLACAGLAVYHALTWPLPVLLENWPWEMRYILPYLAMTVTFLVGAVLLGIGGVMMLRGYYHMGGRFILAGGLLSGYGLYELALAIPAALLGGTLPQPEDEWMRL